MLKPTPINMENYGNTAVKVLGMFHAFLRWKDKVYKQLFYMTDCDRSPNLLSRDPCYILGVLKPCYTVENTSSPTVNASKKGDYITTPVALVQHCSGRGAVGSSSSREAEEHLPGMLVA